MGGTMKRSLRPAGIAGLLLVFVLDLHAPPPADACGVKLIVKNPSPRKSARAAPVRAKNKPVVAAGPQRKPIAAGPQKDRTVVAAKPPEPTPPPKTEPPPPEPAPPPPPPVAVNQKPEKTEPSPPPEVKAPPPPPPSKATPVGAFKATELYFGVNSANTRKGALDKAIKQLNADTSISVTVEGYADPTGNSAYNMKLSQTRAESVRDQLVSGGVDASRIDVQAYGDTKLKYGRSDSRNRRVLIAPKKP